MFIITIYAAAGLITAASVFWLAAKGVLRDDGSYEEWCSTLNPAWRGVAMGAFRCVNHNKDCEFEEDDADDENRDNLDYFQNEDGTVNADWLSLYISRNEENLHRLKLDIEKQAECIRMLMLRDQQMYTRFRSGVALR